MRSSDCINCNGVANKSKFLSIQSHAMPLIHVQTSTNDTAGGRLSSDRPFTFRAKVVQQ